MRKVKKYKKVQGSKKQKKRLETINKFQDNIAKAFYIQNIKTRTNYYKYIVLAFWFLTIYIIFHHTNNTFATRLIVFSDS